MLVNTHAHFDHTFGNQQFGPDSFLDVPIYGHHRLPAHLDQYERPRLAAWHHDPDGEPERDWHDVRITPPTCLVAASRTLNVGERPVELHPLGAGHTDTDLVLHVPDSRAWIVGDVVEASGPPMYGSGCFPLGLPRQLAVLLDELEDGDVVVPGHGLSLTGASSRRSSRRSSNSPSNSDWPTVQETPSSKLSLIRVDGPSLSMDWNWQSSVATWPSTRTPSHSGRQPAQRKASEHPVPAGRTIERRCVPAASRCPKPSVGADGG